MSAITPSMMRNMPDTMNTQATVPPWLKSNSSALVEEQANCNEDANCRLEEGEDLSKKLGLLIKSLESSDKLKDTVNEKNCGDNVESYGYEQISNTEYEYQSADNGSDNTRNVSLMYEIEDRLNYQKYSKHGHCDTDNFILENNEENAQSCH